MSGLYCVIITFVGIATTLVIPADITFTIIALVVFAMTTVVSLIIVSLTITVPFSQRARYSKNTV